MKQQTRIWTGRVAGTVCAAAVLFSAGAACGMTAPTQAAGCVLWLDAADAATIVLTDGRVSQWLDKSGGAKHVSQGAADSRPGVAAASLNGRSTLALDFNDYLSGSAVLAQGDDTFSCFAVWQRNTTDGAGVVFEQAGPGIGARASLLTAGTAYGFNGENNDAHWLAPYGANQWKVSGLEFDGRANRNIYIYDNAGVFIGSINSDTEQVGIDGTRVGAKVMTNGENLNGNVAEIIVYDRILSDTERRVFGWKGRA